MKNIQTLWLSLFAAMVMFASCINEDEIETYPESYIKTFSVGDISTLVSFKLANGEDSTITKVVGGNEVVFNIDHVRNRIQTIDSLPHWVDLTRVVPTITSSSGYVYVQQEQDSVFYPFNSGSDSIDFSKPVKFLVIASDGVGHKTYTAEIFKRTTEADSLVWTRVIGADLELNGAHRTVVLDDRMYVFSENEGEAKVTSSSFLSNGASWRKPASLECESGKIDWQSVTVFGDCMYALNSEGRICRSTADDRGAKWSIVSDIVFTRLLSADRNYIYACDGTSLMASADLQNWRPCGNADLDMLPETFVSYANYDTRTNSALSMSVMTGLNSSVSESAVVWYKISSANEDIDQKWAYVRPDASNAYKCPRFENLSVVYYGGELLAVGTGCKGLYSSKDNGISWHMYEEMKMLPAEMGGQASAPVSMAVGGGYLWLVQSGGLVWKGIAE